MSDCPHSFHRRFQAHNHRVYHYHRRPRHYHGYKHREYAYRGYHKYYKDNHYYYDYDYYYPSIGFLIYPGYSYPSYYDYYPAYTQESVPVYNDDYAEYGFLKLDILPPEAEIFLDGEYLGTAEDFRDRAVSVMPGEHQLRIDIEGFSSFFSVYVSPGSTSYFSKDLVLQDASREDIHFLGDVTGIAEACRPETNEGLLMVHVEPKTADVFLNGDPLGDAQGLEYAGIIVPEGSHTIRFEADGYVPHEETIQVTCGEPVRVNLQMVKEG